NKTDRVRHESGPVRRKRNGADGRVERGKQPPGCGHMRLGQCVEECRLARIRISDERDGMELTRAAVLPMQRAAGPDMLQGLVQPADPSANATAIKLQLLFTGSARADAATQTREQSAAPGEPGQEII